MGTVCKRRATNMLCIMGWVHVVCVGRDYDPKYYVYTEQFRSVHCPTMHHAQDRALLAWLTTAAFGASLLSCAAAF